MPTAPSGDLRIHYEDHGLPDDPPLLLIAGLGNQLLFWEDEFVQGLVDRAFRVIRYDSRDTGLSSGFEDQPVDLTAVLTAIGAGEPIEVPYRLADLAGDVIAVLDHLEIERAHVLGVSLGASVAQHLAIDHADRVQSLTLLSATSGSPDHGQPSPAAATAMLTPGVEGREAVIAQNVEIREVWSTRAHFDHDWTVDYFARSYDRGHNPGGVARQLVALAVADVREDELSQLDVPTLILHGTADPLIDRSGGERLADLIPGAELVLLDDMGHDLPPHYWAPLIESVTQLAIRSMQS